MDVVCILVKVDEINFSFLYVIFLIGLCEFCYFLICDNIVCIYYYLRDLYRSF